MHTSTSPYNKMVGQEMGKEKNRDWKHRLVPTRKARLQAHTLVPRVLRRLKLKSRTSTTDIDICSTEHRTSCVSAALLLSAILRTLFSAMITNRCHSSRYWRKVELPVHPSTPQHQRRWKAENHVRFNQDQGCRSSILQFGLQKGRCRLEQAVGFLNTLAMPYAVADPSVIDAHDTDTILLLVLVKSPPKNSNVSSPSSKILHSIRSRRGSSIVNVISSTAKTPRCWRTAWTANSAKILSV